MIPPRVARAALVVMAAVAATLPSAAAPELRRESIGRGGTLSAALARAGLEGDLLARTLEMAGRHIDLRSLSPDTGVTVTVDGRNAPLAVGIRDAPERVLRIEFPARAELVSLPVVETEAVAAGVVETSVAQALAHERFGTLLTLGFSDVVQWDVDLLIDPRPGDEVRLVYRQRRLGAVPADLPRFGGAADAEGAALPPGRIVAAAYRGVEAAAEAFFVPDAEGGGDYFDAEGRPLRKTFLKSPLNYRRISSRFSRARRNPVTRRVVPHHGVDFAAATGTPVSATADGRVVAAGWDGPLGRSVRIRHGSEWVTVYGHLSRIARGISRGARVRQNDVIGYVGSTGRATGPHLHYTMIKNGTPLDPMRIENPPGEPLPDPLAPRLAAAVRRWRPTLLDPAGDDGQGASATSSRAALSSEP